MQSINLIFHNGHVLTMDSANRRCQALAVSGDKIAAVGSNEAILAMRQEGTRLIDCAGRTLMPGIIDSHTHLWEYGVLSRGLILFGIQDMATLQQLLAEKVNAASAGAWIQGGSWIETQFAENRMPERGDLDPVSPDNPVVFERIFGASAVNTCALKAAGITRNTPDPDGGQIEKDAHGEPNGILHGSAVLLVRACIPNVFGTDDFGSGSGVRQDSQYESYIKEAIPSYLKYGVTSIVEPGVSPAICKAYQSVRAQGALSLRVSLMPNWHGFTLHQQTDKFDRYLDDIGFCTGFGDEWLRLGGLKMAIDGGLTSKTAWLSWPYKGEKEPPKVSARLDLDRFDDWVEKAHMAGWSVGIHVMGDLAIDRAASAIYKAYKKLPVKRLHHLIHAYYPTADSLEKMREAGIMVSVQPAFIYGEADGYGDLLEERCRKAFLPLETYRSKGIVTSMSTDTPCAAINPFWGLYSAVTRKGVQGYCLGEAECVSVADAMRMMTIEGAKITGESDIKGSLEPGKLADLCLLSECVATCVAEGLRGLSVEMTIVGGQIVYQQKRRLE
jgi:predicted amidohydrolase YtcJ